MNEFSSFFLCLAEGIFILHYDAVFMRGKNREDFPAKTFELQTVLEMTTRLFDLVLIDKFLAIFLRDCF